MSKSITTQEKLQLLGLLTLGIQHQKIVNQVEEAMAKISGEEIGGHLSDAVYEGDTDIDKILVNIGIEVTDASA